jgi:hypothetical protein
LLNGVSITGLYGNEFATLEFVCLLRVAAEKSVHPGRCKAVPQLSIHGKQLLVHVLMHAQQLQGMVQ